MDEKDTKMIVNYSVVAGILILIVGALDYFNVMYFISKNINFDFLNIFINALVIIFMFIITYILIDRKTLKNQERIENNKKGILLLLLEKTYNECRNQIDVLDEQEMVEKYLIPKINFNSVDDPFIKNIKSKPFEYEDKIISLFSDGVLDKKYFKEYMNVKDLFELYIGWRITFFDAEKHGRGDLLFYIQERKSNVLKAIRSQQKLIEKLIKHKTYE